MSAHPPADSGRTSAPWSLSTEELKRRIDQMYAGVQDPRAADTELSVA